MNRTKLSSRARMTSLSALAGLALAAWLVPGCGSSGPDSGPPSPDASTAPDGALPDAAPPDAPSPQDGASDAGPSLDASADASDASSDASDAGSDARPDAEDGGDGGPEPCATEPIFVVDGGTAPTRTWCRAFEYPAPNTQWGESNPFPVGAAFSSDGGTTVFGVAGEPSAVLGVSLPAGSPFLIDLDPGAQPERAVAFVPPALADGGAMGQVSILAVAASASGDLAFGGAGATGTQGSSGSLLWTYTPAKGALEGADFFTSATPNGSTSVSSIVPVAGGDFVAAGWCAYGTDFGTGPLQGGWTGGNPFVGRFAPSGKARWANIVASSSEVTPTAYQVAVAADANGHVSVVGNMTPRLDGGTGDGIVVERYDATTGAKLWGAEIDMATGFYPGVSIAADGDDLTLAVMSAAGTSLVGVRGADGSVRYRGPSLGRRALASIPTYVSSIVADGAGGAFSTGTTEGGAFGSLTLPLTSTPACFVAHTDASGNPTWIGECTPRTFAAGATLALSGKSLLLSGTGGMAPPLPGALAHNGPPAGTVPFIFAEAYALP